jgi:hypothetical protein
MNPRKLVQGVPQALVFDHATKRQHPSLSDVALALATRRSEPTWKVKLTWNAKGDVQIEVDGEDPDAKVAAKVTADTFDVLRARYPRENGGGSK